MFLRNPLQELTWGDKGGKKLQLHKAVEIKVRLLTARELFIFRGVGEISTQEYYMNCF